MGEEDKKGNTIEFRAPEPSLYLYKLESGFSAEPKEKKQLLITSSSLLAEVKINLTTLIPGITIQMIICFSYRIPHLGSEIHFIDDMVDSHVQIGEQGHMFTTLKVYINV